MKKLIAPLFFAIIAAAAAIAQPSPPPSGWAVSGSTVSTSNSVLLPRAVTGGAQGVGTINAQGLFRNGNAVAYSFNGRYGAITPTTNDYSFGQISGTLDLTSQVAGVLPTSHGGTGFSGSGTSGGIPYFDTATTLASSGLLTNHALVLGGGAGAAPTPLASLGTTTTVLHGNASGAPTWSAISLTADVSGILPGANGGTGVANSGKTLTLGANLVTTGGATTFALGATGRTYTFPDAADTVVLLAQSQALTNKTYNGNTWTAGTGVLTLGAGKTFTASNTMTQTATDGSTIAFGAGGTVLYSGGAYVASLSGTANEITASASTGSVTLSLPTAITFTGKTVTGGTYASPALSGTVTGNNTVPLGILAQSAANTMLGNWTGSTANVAANTMPSCADTGGNHLNYVSGTGITCGTTGPSSGATFINGALQSSNSTSATGTMAGFGATYTITPTSTGRVTFTMQCWMTNNTITANAGAKGYYGIGLAPISGVPVSGTAFAAAFTLATMQAAGSPAYPVTIKKTVTGLTLGVPVWFDAAITASAGTSTLQCQSADAVEN